ncbi:glucoamylase [Rhodoblastus sphagnicola]|uniref:Glucoamylase n=1 Tax=Rhodoblastus sphagnicola TaxID=333368 RepID=A0A2S6N4E6_9HYPH|nr:glycoside hydrolase family 15 protein [Rhodoblastus sphagnicola]MBB4200332.1 GH15 family glucan-1,4-alpha-glucosidase [Rhodoblastus sphagnicola]PPQ29469.1 glucoamylase [Rhodoblastus sphagnicola]
MSTLELGVIGNCAVAALIDRDARVVWYCLPRFDGDPVFHALLGAPKEAPDDGVFAIEIEDHTHSEQYYVENTAVLVTELHGKHGALRVTDFAPRLLWRDRLFYPQALVRRLTPISGSPRIRIRLRPRFDYGAVAAIRTFGSHHIRYVGPNATLRLTTNAPIDFIRDETVFNLSAPLDLFLGPDETLQEGVAETAERLEARTLAYWRQWTHRLATPFEWQDAVIRAAISLKLCTYEPTGAIVAALTTSIPEGPGTQRNWDYRFCWLRDSYFVVRALNRLAAVRKMENYFRWLMNIVASLHENEIQPVYGIGLERRLDERIAPHLPGYRGMAPARVGNQAYEHLQFDSYGNVILGVAQMFLDRRMLAPPGPSDFLRLEALGRTAVKLHDKPDAGMWEYRTRASIHTTSSLMCWAAADRLARIAAHLGQADGARAWRADADRIRQVILERAWSHKRQAFVDSFEGEFLDAGVLLMTEVGFIDPHDPRMVSTVTQLEKALGRGPHMMRYEAPDDFGAPGTAFNTCSFWRIDALARMGRVEEARDHFSQLLKLRNRLGLMSEDVDPGTGEMWGNYPQTYSLVGIVNCAVRLSVPWEAVI